MASLLGAKNNGAKAQLAATSKVAHSTVSGYISSRVWKVLDCIEGFTSNSFSFRSKDFLFFHEPSNFHLTFCAHGLGKIRSLMLEMPSSKPRQLRHT